MSLLNDIRATLRDVVGSADGLTDAGNVRTITSAPTGQTARTYSDWAATYGLVAGRQINEIADPRTGKLKRREHAFLRVSDAVDLPPGSQWSLDQAEIWEIEGVASSGPGSIRYLISREITERVQSNRGGGV